MEYSMTKTIFVTVAGAVIAALVVDQMKKQGLIS